MAPGLESVDYSHIGLTMLMLGLAIFFLVLIWKQYFTPRGKVLHRLKTISRNLQQQKAESHHIAFSISAALCDGLHLGHIGETTVLPPSLLPYAAEWEDFVQRLSVARYAAAALNTAELSALAQDASLWLRRWP